MLSVANVLQLCIKIISIFLHFFSFTSDAADLGPVTTPQLQSGYRGAAERLQSDGSEGQRQIAVTFYCPNGIAVRPKDLEIR